MSNGEVLRMTPDVEVSALRGLKPVSFKGKTLAAVFLGAGRWLAEREGTAWNRVVFAVTLEYGEAPPNTTSTTA